VFVVAVAELAGEPQAEAVALAADLGVTAYDARLLLAAGLPAVVRSTPDRDAALELLRRLRARGHGALACDAAAVVASADMVSMRHFRVEPAQVVLDDRPDLALPYDDVVALVLAAHRARSETVTVTRESRLSVGRAIMTSGLSMTKSIEKQTRSVSDEREHVLYVFRRSGQTPWMLHERGTAWSGHGRTVAPSEGENFRLTVAALRERAPGAAYDERLVARRAPERAALSGGRSGSTVRTSSEGAIDLLAHVLALWLTRGRAAP
jgi:hypothetical protein